MKLTHCFHALAGCLLMWTTLQPAVAQDKTVLGIAFASRYAVPACKPGETTFPPRLCFDTTLTKRQATGADEYHVFIPSADTPPYVRGGVRVAVLDGIVVSVLIGTWGLQSQDLALAAFTKQFGAPTRTQREKQPGLRARIRTLSAEWDLKDFSARLDGSTGSVDWGRLEVSTHRYRKLVEENAKRSPAKSTQ